MLQWSRVAIRSLQVCISYEATVLGFFRRSAPFLLPLLRLTEFGQFLMKSGTPEISS